MRLTQFPSCTIASCGASFSVVSLTEGKVILFAFSWNDRSNMTLKDLLLCGMQATGEIFKFFGQLFLMSLNLTIFANPFFIFDAVSAWSAAAASQLCADLCGPWSIAFMMWSIDQSSPQSTGQPFVAYSFNNLLAGWFKEYVRGHIKPILPISFLIGILSGILSSFQILLLVILSISSLVAALGFLIFIVVFAGFGGERCSKTFGLVCWVFVLGVVGRVVGST